jgi:hypothetical protein
MLIPEYDKEVIIQSRGIKKKITTKTEDSDLDLEEIPELQITEDEFVKYSD